VEAAQGSGIAIEGTSGWEPRRPGLVDRLILFIDNLPGPTILWLIALFFAWEITLNGVLWLFGAVPFGVIDQEVSFAPTLGVYAIGLVIALDHIARSAVAQFQPALGDAPGGDHLTAELTHLPDKLALLTVVVTVVAVTVGYVLDPTSGPRLLARSLLSIAAAFVGYWLSVACLAILILHTVRQLWLVSRLHAVATMIDLFNPVPINALARLTAATAVGIVLAAIPFTVQLPEFSGQGSFFGLITGILLLLLAVASFALPLRGMHDRMVLEKRRLMAGSSSRLKVTVQRVHDTVDTDDITRADGLQKTLTSLLSERDVVSKLPTWPWSPGTFRGFASAVLLPIVIWVVLRLLERFV